MSGELIILNYFLIYLVSVRKVLLQKYVYEKWNYTFCCSYFRLQSLCGARKVPDINQTEERHQETVDWPPDCCLRRFTFSAEPLCSEDDRLFF